MPSSVAEQSLPNLFSVTLDWVSVVSLTFCPVLPMSLCQVTTCACSAPEPSVAAKRTASKLPVLVTRSLFTIPPHQLQFEGSIRSPTRHPNVGPIEGQPLYRQIAHV